MHSAQYRVSINFLLDIEAVVNNFYPQENSLICQQRLCDCLLFHG